MNMYIFITLVFVVTVGVVLVVIRGWLKQIEKNAHVSADLVEWMKDIGRRMETSSDSVDRKLSQNMEMFNDRLDRAARVMGDVQKHIGEFSEIGRSIKEFQQLLRSPKLRGNIGEQILKDILKMNFPHNSYYIQRRFQSGHVVDAAIKTSQGLIPIDSKFPIDSFRRLVEAEGEEEKAVLSRDFIKGVKKHILDISTKYILPDENTVDYALMYIPSEAVYYEIVNAPDLYDYASKMRVLPVSPLTFYAYMKAILMSFEGEKIQKQAQEIISLLQGLKKDYEKSDDSLSTLSKHMVNAQNQLITFTRLHQSLGQKIDSTRTLGSVAEEKLIDQ